MDRALIEQLSDAYENKRMAVEMHRALNVFGKTTEERMQMAREYHIAEAEMIEARKALDAAKNAA